MDKYKSAKIQEKNSKKQFKQDVKDYKKNGYKINYEKDVLGNISIKNLTNSKGESVNSAYAKKVMAKANLDKALKTYAAVGTIAIGANVVNQMLINKRVGY